MIPLFDGALPSRACRAIAEAHSMYDPHQVTMRNRCAVLRWLSAAGSRASMDTSADASQ